MINKAIIIGNLGADPEIRATQNGTQVATFNVATTERWRGQDGQLQESTEWHRVVAWARLAEICGQYLQKGSKVYIEGRLQTRKWQGQDGQDRYTTEIIAREMKMLSPKGEGSQGGGYGGGSAGAQGGGTNEPPPFAFSNSGTGDDVPF